MFKKDTLNTEIFQYSFWGQNSHIKLFLLFSYTLHMLLLLAF